MKDAIVGRFILSAVVLAALLPGAGQAAPVTVQSPGDAFAIHLSLSDSGRPTYSVNWRGGEIIAPSGLGFVLGDGIDWSSGFDSLSLLSRSEKNETWKPVWGERSLITDRHRGGTVLFQRKDPPAELKVEIRAYDEGVAFRYIIEKGPAGAKIAITSEQTQFQFTADHDVWAVTSAQGKYRKIKLSGSKGSLERPCVLETAEGKVIAVAEAALVDYARMRVRRPETGGNMLVSSLQGPVTATLPLTTPWRVVMAADTAGKLLENNHLILNLNEPCAIKDTSWIRPGKVLREVSLSTEGGKACVDFAVKNGLQYIEYDAGYVDETSSHASQLAKFVCFFSPLQFLFWYDRPSSAQGEPELEFWRHLPTAWDESRVLRSKIGEFAVIARRNGAEWYVGCLNAVVPRVLAVPLNFLPKGEAYTASIYRDDPTIQTRTKVSIERREVDSKAVIEATMGLQGGMAIRLVPAKERSRDKQTDRNLSFH